LNDSVVDPLVAGLKRREPAALRAIYERYKNDVLSVAAAVLGPRAAEAWDVLHEVFLALARVAGDLRDDTNLRAYLTRAAVNRARDRFKTMRAAGSVDELQSVASDEPDITELLERDEEAAAVMKHLAALPEEQRVVVSLRIWGGMSFPEIAASEGISENTAQSRYRYALEKLRRHYEGAER
jgi:RNA polymerase sigma-70 factor (ECF subfamily)